MEHIMQLRPSPFNMIKSGTKSIELRLYDEKRQKIKIGDTICFYNTENSEQLTVIVKDLFIYESFEELYKNLPLNECGYTASDISNAKPEDMLQYYPIDKQKQYGVVGIQVELI
ncbi:MAG: ASCH domain-containing protein [Candidatus Fimenecus sp.]